jgi:hypothetical protein
MQQVLNYGRREYYVFDRGRFPTSLVALARATSLDRRRLAFGAGVSDHAPPTADLLPVTSPPLSLEAENDSTVEQIGRDTRES